MSNKVICKRCLLEKSMIGYEKVLDDYIDSLDESLKVPLSVYEDRLSKCDRCSELLNGMCRLCGCFVRVRAYKAALSCPLDEPKWKAVKKA